MEQLYLIVIASLVVVGLLLLFVFKPDLAKKCWAYILGGAALIGGIVFFLGQRKRPATPDPVMAEKEKKLQEDLRKVHEEAEAAIQAAREKEQEVHIEIEEIKQIEDDEERLQRLAALFNRTRRRR